MDVREAILERRTVHAYARDPVPDDVIERALEAAIHAPNHKLTWPWRFLRVGRSTREGIADLAVRLKVDPDASSPELVARVRGKILDPHELIVVSVRRHDDPLRAREDYASCACAIQNLQLSLWSEGAASKWSTGAPTRHPETYAMLGIDPEAEEIIGFVWVGSPERVPERPQRPALDEVVRRLP